MPIHDWTRVDSGLFHDFHQRWTAEISNALNLGILPQGYYSLVEQRVDGPEPDVLAVSTNFTQVQGEAGATAIADPPRTRVVARLDSDATAHARRANRIVVRHALGEVVAVIEVVSPGNKDSRHAIRAFVQKAASFLRSGVHLLVIDLFPPTPRDPEGIHKAIADEFHDDAYEPPADKPLTLVGYAAGSALTAYIEPVAIGDPMPDMPLFLTPTTHVLVPLESTYAATWASTPAPIRALLEKLPQQ